MFVSVVMYCLSLSMRSHCLGVGFGVSAVRKLWIVCFVIDWMVNSVFFCDGFRVRMAFVTMRSWMVCCVGVVGFLWWDLV